MHALKIKQNVVVVANDTDVLVLLVWAYTHFKVPYKWYFMYEKGSYADISVICNHFGDNVCESIHLFHAITGCDTASYMFRVGKKSAFQKLLKNVELCSLLHNLRNIDPLQEQDINDLKVFVQTALYSGKKSESYVETRARLYDQQKNKTSTNLPPDPDSLLQDLRRKQLQVLIWQQMDNVTMDEIDPLRYGWKTREEDKMLVPLWFTGKQFPPCLQKFPRGRKKPRSPPKGSKVSRKRRFEESSEGELADCELSDHCMPPPEIEVASCASEHHLFHPR